jgi:phospholipase/carboxylesterase
LPLRTYTLPPADGGKPRAVAVLLHGVGSNGQDLIGLAPYWAEALPHVEFLSPDGPEAYDMAPGMAEARQWFSLADRDLEIMTRGIGLAAPKLDAYLDAVKASRGLENRQIALVGFSQGTMMALHVGLRRQPALAGILGYSGALLVPPPPLPQPPPVLLVHGVDDAVVPFAAMAIAQSMLKPLGVEVEILACRGLGHSIDELGIVRGGQFLSRCLAPASIS